jgi:hypothetical protein
MNNERKRFSKTEIPDVKNDFLVIFKNKETGRIVQFGWVDPKEVALDEVKSKIKEYCEKNTKGETAELIEDGFIKEICGFCGNFKYGYEPKQANHNLIEAIRQAISDLDDMKSDLEDAVGE